MKALQFDGKEVEIDKNCLSIGNSWINHKGKIYAYDYKLVEFFYNQITDNSVVLDVGASSGNFSLIAKFKPDCWFHCFEPLLEVRDLLIKNRKLNKINTDKMKIYYYALMDYRTASEAVDIKIPRNKKEMGLSSLGNPLRFSEWDTRKIHTQELDNLYSLHSIKKIDFIKVDIEGAELQFLKGAFNRLKSNMPAMLIEYNETNFNQFGYTKANLIDYLKQIGYTNFENVGREDLWVTK